MRKTRIIAFVVASLVSTAAALEAQAPAKQQRGARAEGRQMGQRGRAMQPARRAAQGPFRGITLSETEKGRIKEIREKYRSENQTLRASFRPVMEEMRTARQKRDTAAVRAAFSKAQASRERVRVQMERERAEIRSALSSENQKRFDANTKRLEERRAAMAKRGAVGRRGARGAGRAGAVQRPGRGARPGRGPGRNG